MEFRKINMKKLYLGLRMRIIWGNLLEKNGLNLMLYLDRVHKIQKVIGKPYISQKWMYQ
jgi:hypothetical protein